MKPNGNNNVLGTGLGLVLGCLLPVVALRCEAQGNLVPNPGFEETDSCTFGLGLGALHNWYSVYLTPDHLKSCLPYGAVGSLPMNNFTFQQPYEGDFCVGFFTYANPSSVEQREWIMVPLLEPMIPGQTYHCSFRANAGFGGNETYPTIWLASNHVGMLFTTYDRHWEWGDPYPAALNFAHIENPQVLADTAGWSLVGGSFVADSAYRYVMIGNFFGNDQTDTLHLAPPSTAEVWWDFSYTLIDAVCVSPANGCELVHGEDEPYGAGPYVYPNPATDVLVIGNVADQEAGIWDILGRRVWGGTVVGTRHTLGVVDWARGAYVLQVRGAGGIQVVKFVLAE